MPPPNLRALLAADPDAGAGTILSTRIRLGIGLDEPRSTFDTAVDDRPAWAPFTVRELDRVVRSRAAALHELGVRPRDPVAVFVTSAADNVLAFLALSRLGAIAAPVNPNLDGEKAALYISRLHATAVLTDAAHRADDARVMGGKDRQEPAQATLDREHVHDVRAGQPGLRPGVHDVVDLHGEHLVQRVHRLAGERRP